MVRIAAVGVVLALLASAAMAGTVIDFESGLPPGASAFGNAGVVGGLGPIPAPEGFSMFVASTGGSVASIPAGLPPATFVSGDPAGAGGGSITEYSGLSYTTTLTVPSFVSLLLNIATGEITGGIEDLFGIWVDSGSGPVAVDGYVVDPTGSATYLPPFTGLGPGAFSGVAFTDPLFGTFDDGDLGTFLSITGFLPAGTSTITFAVADFTDEIVDTAFMLDKITITEVPEPGTWLLFGMGALGLAGFRRMRRRKATA